jgi:hypothetical protein
MIHLVLQQARGQARLCDRREVHASLDRGAKPLELLGQLNMVRCGHRRGERARCPPRARYGSPARPTLTRADSIRPRADADASAGIAVGAVIANSSRPSGPPSMHAIQGWENLTVSSGSPPRRSVPRSC